MSVRKKQTGIMKATPLEQRHLTSLGHVAIAQPKLRGQRARTVWVGTTPVLLSSYGVPFAFLEHITDSLVTLPRLCYDGELYCHDSQFTQEMHNSILNRQENRHELTEWISYYIFDVINADEQWQRLIERDHALRCLRNRDEPVKLLDYRLIQTGEWPSHCQEYLESGYEGIILRALNNRYEPLDVATDAKRPRSILKFKPTSFDEYTITDLIEGTGWCTGMLGAFKVCSPDNPITFLVGTGPELTKEKRQKYWLERTSLIGRTLVVKHEPITTRYGIPICTSAYEIKMPDEK
jgi:ATP-dependent DNA ligase